MQIIYIFVHNSVFLGLPLWLSLNLQNDTFFTQSSSSFLKNMPNVHTIAIYYFVPFFTTLFLTASGQIVKSEQWERFPLFPPSPFSFLSPLPFPPPQK